MSNPTNKYAEFSPNVVKLTDLGSVLLDDDENAPPYPARLEQLINLD
jgi:hypothetical protein